MMRMVLHHGTKLDYNEIITIKKMNKDIDNIYVYYKDECVNAHSIHNGDLYRFNRYDPNFIADVEKAIATSPYPAEVSFYIYNLDKHLPNRCTEVITNIKDYYTIVRSSQGLFETVTIHRDKFINDVCDKLDLFMKDAQNILDNTRQNTTQTVNQTDTQTNFCAVFLSIVFITTVVTALITY
jgi:hypothetical protein